MSRAVIVVPSEVARSLKACSRGGASSRVKSAGGQACSWQDLHPVLCYTWYRAAQAGRASLSALGEVRPARGMQRCCVRHGLKSRQGVLLVRRRCSWRQRPGNQGTMGCPAAAPCIPCSKQQLAGPPTWSVGASRVPLKVLRVTVAARPEAFRAWAKSEVPLTRLVRVLGTALGGGRAGGERPGALGGGGLGGAKVSTVSTDHTMATICEGAGRWWWKGMP